MGKSLGRKKENAYGVGVTVTAPPAGVAVLIVTPGFRVGDTNVPMTFVGAPWVWTGVTLAPLPP